MRSFLGKLATLDKNDLTTRETKIAEYIKKNLVMMVETDMKIVTLSHEVGTGYSAIYGLLKKLNIQGYRDFSISLANDADAMTIDVSKDDENVSRSYISMIKHNHSLIDKKMLFDTLNLIKSANRIYVVYWESVLRGAATELTNFFYSEKLPVTLLDSDWDTINQRVADADKEDLFLFYTKYGASTHLAKVIEKIRNKGGKVVFVSGRIPTQQIDKHANLIHTLIIDNVEEGGECAISKSVPFHYFNDLLVYHFQHLKKNN
ncbi:MurR/RpiR family transcriptional regulator [Williamsoniiplasma lucivorax]|uniref:HTH rpiR-type domain-containing protein n=1 Tax=Williamsoniiplasma lucivorax TaxID=209274 RepID=A0A2S5R9S8_9MOLU|nr:MurR/RpiR family transcriptional regulator [Williamsoniiplasma lucivorax]PPE03952.1 hypothetical protein ELUCI_v1c09580 [Williamsoniiplasma lucivorax]